MTRISALTDEQAAAFGHAFVRWLTDEDPAHVAQYFKTLDPQTLSDVTAADLGRSVLEDVVAERFLKLGEE
jgi:hypothetical protein